MAEQKPPPDDDEESSGGEHRPEHRRPHPGSENLLPPWKPGQSGNPDGLPKGRRSLTARLQELLDADRLYHPVTGKVLQLIEGMQVADLIVAVYVYEAAKGSAKHGHEVWDRMDGKVTTPPPAGQIDMKAAARKAKEILEKRKRERTDGKPPRSD